MEKEKVKSIDVKNLPVAPEIPAESKAQVSPGGNIVKLEHDPFSLLYDYKDREAAFIKSLNESIKMFDNENSFSSDPANADMSNDGTTKSCEDECLEYISPLMMRTQDSITSLLATKDSLDQLDNLHRIIKQLLSVQEQNYQIRKRLRTVKTLQALKSMEIQMNVDPEKFIRSSMEDGSNFDINEIEENMANLENIIAAGASASNKRSSSKKQRSKSIISEDFTVKENDRNYPLRRQSAISDFKPKVSKWTKVKAAFKWEKTNALPLIESKSSDSVLSPNNSELARYLRVPTNPHGCSSGDSLFSGSSSYRLGTPPEISSAASSADENDEEKMSRNRSFIGEASYHDEERRSHSLDLILGPNILHQLEKSKNKSAWSKVKGIVANRNSRKSVKSTGSTNSRDESPADIQRERTDSLSSSNQPSPSHVGVCNLIIPDNDYGATSSGYSHQMSSDDNESNSKQKKSNRQGKKGSRPMKHVPEIESLVEGVPFETNTHSKIPHPLNLQKDLYESDGFEGANSNSPNSTSAKTPQKRNSTSVPNSPSKGMEFFSENEFSSSGDYSESPLKRGSNNSSKSSRQQDEILRNYHELQKKINMEFEKKKTEWEKIRPLVIQLNNSVPTFLKEDLSLPSTPKNIISNINLNEEKLSADFKKKLDEWRMKKRQQSMKESSKKHQQQPDWQLWKTGQIKLENQGLIALPDARDLPEDFQKKLNEWKQMKTEGRVPTYTTQCSMQEKMKRQFSKSDSKSSSSSSSMKKSKTFDDKSEGFSKLRALVIEPINKEIVVKTSEGTMKFQGISRKFTRKLYEWEKAKGIAPESSTFALLHPEYKAILENDAAEKSSREKSGLKRCLSVDSVKPAPTNVDIQLSHHHQQSSLSLNDVENLKEKDSNRRIASSLDNFKQSKENDEIDNDEPGAMLVEIEDETYETVSNATPITQMQIPVFKFDFANRDSRHEPADCIHAMKEVKDVFEKANNCILDIYKTSEVSITSIKHLTNIFKYINHSLIQLKETSKDYSSAYLEQALTVSNGIASDFEQVDNSFSESSLLEKLPNINSKSSQLKDALCNLETFFIDSQANSTEGFKAKRTIQHVEDGQKGVATVKVTPTFVCNSVKMNEVYTVTQPMKANSDSEMPGSTGDVGSEEKVTRKVTRNTSNGSKRKIRLRRMGSRQSSKTESDTEDEQTASSDVTRKVKRKTSRAKKQLESDKSFETFQAEDEVAYVFKIKPGEKNEVTVKPVESTKPIEITKPNMDDSILISPTENSIQIVESNATTQNVFVKTRRKIFTPIEVQDSCVNTTISQEIESSSASDKNDNDKISQQLAAAPQGDGESHNIISTLPPLPSPKFQRKNELTKQNSSKDLSPSIRLMISRYKSSIDKKANSPNSSGSGSCSPIWRSPILDRRVRKQSAEYQDKLLKSNSSQEIHVGGDEKGIETPEKVNTEENTDTSIEPVKVSDTGSTDQKEQELKVPLIEKSFSDTVTMRSDCNKPRTPLSERALKIKQAKEAFLKMPLISHDSSGHSDWTYRLSQISVGSTDSFTDNCSLIKCLSAGVLPDNNADQEDTTSIETKSSSLPRNSKGLNIDSENVSESSRGSRFNLSSLATKLRKVKLKRNTKESKKMNTVGVLCHQSLTVDFSANSSQGLSQPPDLPLGPSRFRKNKHDNIKKSKSLGILEAE